MNFIKPPREKDLRPDEGFRREGEEDERFNFLTRYHAMLNLFLKYLFALFPPTSGIKGTTNVYSIDSFSGR